MALLERLLAGRIQKGMLNIHRANGECVTIGAPADGWPNIDLRIHAANAERRILTNPKLGLGECFMDGSLSVDNEDIMGLISLVRDNNIWEKGGRVTETAIADAGGRSALRTVFRLRRHGE